MYILEKMFTRITTTECVCVWGGTGTITKKTISRYGILEQGNRGGFRTMEEASMVKSNLKDKL